MCHHLTAEERERLAERRAEALEGDDEDEEETVSTEPVPTPSD
ncbi:MAG: hypothetical protein ABEI31_06810 [Halodesulfurarchaeum sp.]